MVSKHKAGLAVGSILGLWRLTWSLLVAIGLAQSLHRLDLSPPLHSASVYDRSIPIRTSCRIDCCDNRNGLYLGLAFGGDLEFAAASGDPLEGCMGCTTGLILASRGIC